MKKVKIFLAIFIPVFIAGAIYYNKNQSAKWIGYVLAGVLIAGIIWLLKNIIPKSK